MLQKLKQNKVQINYNKRLTATDFEQKREESEEAGVKMYELTFQESPDICNNGYHLQSGNNFRHLFGQISQDLTKLQSL